MKFSKVLLVLTLLCVCCSFSNAQSQSCSGPSVSYAGKNVVVDFGMCLALQGGSDAFTYDSAYAPQFQDTFLSNPVTVTLDWSSPDTYSVSYTVWLSDTAGNALSAPVTLTPSGSGAYSAQLSTQFRSGMLLRVAEHMSVVSANDQCFAFGYYCYFNAKFTLHN